MKPLLDPSLPLHFAAILILTAFFIGVRYGAGRAERRKQREQDAIWQREQAKLPRAYRQ